MSGPLFLSGPFFQSCRTIQNNLDVVEPSIERKIYGKRRNDFNQFRKLLKCSLLPEKEKNEFDKYFIKMSGIFQEMSKKQFSLFVTQRQKEMMKKRTDKSQKKQQERKKCQLNRIGNSIWGQSI